MAYAIRTGTVRIAENETPGGVSEVLAARTLRKCGTYDEAADHAEQAAEDRGLEEAGDDWWMGTPDAQGHARAIWVEELTNT